VLEVTKETFEEEVTASSTPVVVDFWGPQCAPCLALMPFVEQLAKDHGDSLKIVKVEAPKNRRLCLQLQVLSLPTFLFYKDGREVGRLAGTVTPLQIKEGVAKLVTPALA
jgi:thioredoxin 1